MKKRNYYTTNEIKPRGWLKKQLRIQANGLCGNLDKVWRDVRDSAWIGGDADGWVRPQWKLFLTHILFRGGDSEAIELICYLCCSTIQM